MSLDICLIVQPAVIHVHLNAGVQERGNMSPTSVTNNTFLPTDYPYDTPNASKEVLISKTICEKLFQGWFKNYIDKLKKFLSWKYSSLLGIAVDLAIYLTLTWRHTKWHQQHLKDDCDLCQNPRRLRWKDKNFATKYLGTLIWLVRGYAIFETNTEPFTFPSSPAGWSMFLGDPIVCAME